MSDETDAPSELPLAERRLLEHLAVLRVGPPVAPPALTDRVVSTARWQRVVRGPLRAAASVGAAFVEGITVVLGRKGRRR